MVGGCIIKGNTSHSGFQASSTRREIWNCLATCRWMQWFWTVPSQISANSRRYILDSGFWERLFTKSSGSQELVDKGKEHGVHVPKMVMKMALHMIKGSVQRAAGFSITDLVPVQHANACTVPALFITAENDDFISPAHAELLYEVCSRCLAVQFLSCESGWYISHVYRHTPEPKTWSSSREITTPSGQGSVFGWRPLSFRNT